MRKSLYVAPIMALAACAVAPAASDVPAVPAAANPASSGECEASGTQSFVGQPRSPATGAAILAATGSTQIRWVTPDMMVTMDFQPSRVTVHLDANDRITRIVCG